MTAVAHVIELPTEKVLFCAAKLALEQNKSIRLDYYKETFLSEDKDTKEKILVKNAREYTSPIQKMFKVLSSDGRTDYIFITGNSIYITSSSLKRRASLHRPCSRTRMSIHTHLDEDPV